MKRPFIITCLSMCFPLFGATVARAQEAGEAQGYYIAQAAQMPEPVQPPSAAPAHLRQRPPAQPPAPPVQRRRSKQQAPQAPMPQPQGRQAGGQWVYTSQYGWVYMPYGDQYAYEGTAYDPLPIPTSTIHRTDGCGWRRPGFGAGGRIPTSAWADRGTTAGITGSFAAAMAGAATAVAAAAATVGRASVVKQVPMGAARLARAVACTTAPRLALRAAIGAEPAAGSAALAASVAVVVASAAATWAGGTRRRPSLAI
jgi:hypothetical protein